MLRVAGREARAAMEVALAVAARAAEDFAMGVAALQAPPAAVRPPQLPPQDSNRKRRSPLGEATKALRCAAAAVDAGRLLTEAALTHLKGERRADVLVAIVPGCVERRGDGELLAALARVLCVRVQAYEARARAASGADTPAADGSSEEESRSASEESASGDS